jgi:hypothetical protein
MAITVQNAGGGTIEDQTIKVLMDRKIGFGGQEKLAWWTGNRGLVDRNPDSKALFVLVLDNAPK